jgi:hypothetical protein
LSSTKNCNSCGASNDTILKNRIYCHSQLLFNDDDAKSISDEELIEKASKWVSLAGKDSKLGRRKVSSIFNQMVSDYQ